jgi:hypothetical protein
MGRALLLDIINAFHIDQPTQKRAESYAAPFYASHWTRLNRWPTTQARRDEGFVRGVAGSKRRLAIAATRLS